MSYKNLVWRRHSNHATQTERIRSTLEGLPEQPPTLVPPTAAAFPRKSLIPCSQLGRRETAQAGQPLFSTSKSCLVNVVPEPCVSISCC